MTPGITERMRGGVVVVTATHRLAQRLIYKYSREQLSRGLGAWETPRVLSWGAWLKVLWREYASGTDVTLLLNDVQQLELWQEIIQQSPQARRLLHSRAVAVQALDAWSLAQQWRLPVFDEAMYLNEDARAFRGWAQAYRSRCRDEHWIDDLVLPEQLASALRGGFRPSMDEILFVGFDEYTPQRKLLTEALSATGIAVEEQLQKGYGRDPRRVEFDDARTEMSAAAAWARALLTHQADTSVGIIVPDLHARRGEVEAVFEDALSPEALVRPLTAGHSPWSIAPGVPMAQVAPVHTALILLSLCSEAQPLAAVGRLLSSPFIKGAEPEAAARARLDAELRRFGEPEVSLTSLAVFAKRQPCPVLAHALEALQQQLAELPRRQGAETWARTFSSILSAFGWPGERPPDSAEFQALSAWRDKVLGGFASLDLVRGGMDLEAASSRLRRLAADTSFQPETAEAPVQILGITGAADMRFDALWVMGLHEEVWPPPARPNPFLPIVMQRRGELPNASPELSLSRARRITERLGGAAEQVIFSWPANDGDRPLRPSPLLQPFEPDKELAVAAPYACWVDRTLASAKLESFVDLHGPGLASGSRAHGGAGLFADQAACPFRAFARHRLQAKGLEDTDIGLDARDRGQLVHAALQRFWEDTRSHAGLLALAAPALDAAIARAVDAVLAQQARQRPLTCTARFLELERTRLCALLRDWLALERQRAPFTVVACEQKQAGEFAGMDVSTRIDRIDELEDGGRVILDYKTGSQLNSRAWDGERPDEPQLPLYALISEPAPAALAFAGVRRGALKFQGESSRANAIDGLVEVDSWPQRIEEWRRVLTQLAGEFREGRAEVAPKTPRTCGLCDLHGLCRIHELAPVQEQDNDA